MSEHLVCDIRTRCDGDPSCCSLISAWQISLIFWSSAFMVLSMEEGNSCVLLPLEIFRPPAAPMLHSYFSEQVAYLCVCVCVYPIQLRIVQYFMSVWNWRERNLKKRARAHPSCSVPRSPVALRPIETTTTAATTSASVQSIPILEREQRPNA